MKHVEDCIGSIVKNKASVHRVGHCLNHFPRFKNRDDGALDASVCIQCTDSVLMDSKESSEGHFMHEVHCVLHYRLVS